MRKTIPQWIIGTAMAVLSAAATAASPNPVGRVQVASGDVMQGGDHPRARRGTLDGDGDRAGLGHDRLGPAVNEQDAGPAYLHVARTLGACQS